MSKIHTASARLYLLVILALLLTACSSKQTDISNPPTRPFAHESGVTAIPVQPVRVASDRHMGHLIKLGIKPIAVRENMLEEA